MAQAIAERPERQPGSGLCWPRKHDVFGVGISQVMYDDAVETIVAAAAAGIPAFMPSASSGLAYNCKPWMGW